MISRNAGCRRQACAWLGIGWCFLLGLGPLAAHEIYVDPRTGDDAADGLAAVPAGAHGPVKTLARSVRLAGPGDTIHLAKTTYNEYLFFYGDRSGEPGKPITVDGHEAVISGCVPLDPAEWKQVAPGLYRNETIFKTVLHSIDNWAERFSFVIDGKLNRMNHSLKAPTVPWKSPADLQAGEWTYQQDDGHAYYVKIDPARRLADCRIEVPVIVSGVQFDGSMHDVVIKNLTVTHVINDAFALTVGRTPDSKVRDIHFQNIKAIEACDDGLSAHGDCAVKVEGLYCEDCSTGIASTGTSINDRVVTRNIHGFDLLFGEGRHVVRNSFIEGRGGSAGISIETWSKKPGEDRCELRLENVAVGRTLNETDPAGRVVVNGTNVLLDIQHTTLLGMSLLCKNGGSLKVHDSLIGGGARCQIEIMPDSKWLANHNAYHLGLIRIGGTAYAPQDFAACQKATGQDEASLWKALESAAVSENRDRVQVAGKPVGADRRLIPKAGDFLPEGMGNDR